MTRKFALNASFGLTALSLGLTISTWVTGDDRFNVLSMLTLGAALAFDAVWLSKKA